ncbi:MAG TPA: sigma-70 family RNA polymerase sigma factor [Planctomycetota bacterium]
MNWNDLSRRYGDRVLLIARSILRDETLAMDVAQDALLKIGRALNGSADVRNYEAWILTVAGNAARDALRRTTRRREVAMEKDVIDSRTPDEAVLANESRARVSAALEALPAGARDVLLLKFREGLSGPEIARALGVSLEAAWQQMSRALKLLKSKLSENA